MKHVKCNLTVAQCHSKGKNLNYCGRQKPCLNGGICTNTNITSQPFQCTCPRGWTGETCEKRLKACDLHPCKRGHCRETIDDGFDCVCEPGWRGELCDQSKSILKILICINLIV
ncbi:unnamed protein product [Rodentolepis nana]|uniref:EGF-like domain-containing protein n=1 Tax=Rodentolepis nana TaxID=102285 RepID=A0A0R3TGI6_RODNA|nr:unnamed protein product [Rodentolepis nana]